MSDTDRTTDRRECGGDVAAYALGALDPAETQAFRRHLDTCSVCQEELASFQQVVNELPLAAPPREAPAAVRRKVMREVAAGARRRRPSGSPASRRRGRAPAWLTPRPVLALAVTLLVALGVIVGVSSNSSSGPGTRVVTAHVVGGGSAQLRIARGRGSLIVRHFAPPPAGRIYEVWLARGTQAPAPTSALFGVTSAGNADVEVPGSLHGVSTVMVTPEPLGGSPHPTHAPVISISLA